MVNFGAPETVPAKYADRLLYRHNPLATLMRTTKEENAKLGVMIAAKLNKAIGPTIFMIPKRGVSSIGAQGEPFYDPEADAALFEVLKENLAENVRVVEMDTDINDAAFAVEAARLLVACVSSARTK
jgi:uncharacterized protein (UPF0261 family)